MTTQTPRITAHYLEQFIGQTVRIVGHVTKLMGDTAIIDASGPITLILMRVDPLPHLGFLYYHIQISDLII
jgi:replication factor A3